MIKESVYLVLIFYCLFFAIQVFVGFLLQRRKERRYEQKGEILPSEITVIIPFRNEENRIRPLLQSILNLSQYPKRFIFVDDHSSDATVTIIEDTLIGVPFEIVSMNDVLEGKKYAIREGAKRVNSRYTLTWDADITVAPEYFEKLQQLGHADLYVLPAILEPSSAVQYLYEFDVVLGNAFNAGISGWMRPIFASGANLLYNTEAFQKYDSITAHAHVSSGDDTFLLGDFIRHKADVRLHTSCDLAIRTETPQSFREYLEQRLRWVSKTKALGDSLNTLVAMQQFFFTLLIVSFTILLFAMGQIDLAMIMVLGKLSIDVVVFAPYFIRLRRTTTFLILPLAELWFPLFSLIIAVLIPFYQPKWKGRTVKTKK